MKEQQQGYSWDLPDDEELVPLGQDAFAPENKPPAASSQSSIDARDPARSVTVNGIADTSGVIIPGRAGRSGRIAISNRAGEFTEEYMLRPRLVGPSHGWRLWLSRATAGILDLGPSRKEIAERELIARIKTPVSGCRRIAVISRKGGVGKTTTTLMLGHTFATYRGDRVVALDGNPDAGSLGYRVKRETSKTVTDLLADTESIDRYSDVRAYTSQAPTRLEVVSSDDDPKISQALGKRHYQRLSELLERHFNVMLLDTGTGILDSSTRGIVDLADQIVVVMAPSLDGSRAASLTLDWLEEHGYRDLVAQAVAVINSIRPKALVEVERIEEHFARRTRGVIRIPWDKHLEAGAETAPESLRNVTRAAYLQLAAAVADGFSAEKPQKKGGVA